jgi:DNA-damage-inducible protein D
VTTKHVQNNRDVRDLLVQRNIVPESLPPAEDIRKVERRLKADEQRVPRRATPLPKGDPVTEQGDGV